MPNPFSPFVNPVQWWRAFSWTPEQELQHKMRADLLAARHKLYAYRRQLESEQQDLQDTQTAIDTLKTRIINIQKELSSDEHV